jgi:DNA-binding beta-propeller fold protein YncE
MRRGAGYLHVSDGVGRRLAALAALTLLASTSLAAVVAEPLADAQSTSTVQVGNDPTAVAVDYAASTTYVVNTDSSTVSMINEGSCNATVTSGCGGSTPTAPVATNPDALAIDQSTNTLYVATQSGVVSVLSTTSCNATHSSCPNTPPQVSVGSPLNGVAVDEATDTIYVSGGQSLWVINGANCSSAHMTCTTPQAVVPIGLSPTAVAVDQTTDTIYVADANGTVSVINGNTCNGNVTSGCSAPLANIPVGNQPDALDIDETTNTIYVADKATDTVSVINGANCDMVTLTGCSTPPVNVNVGVGPDAVSVDQSTNAIYVTNGGNNTLSVIDGNRCNGSLTTGCGFTPPALPTGNQPDGVSIDETSDTSYVANAIDNTVTVLPGAVPIVVTVSGTQTYSVSNLALTQTNNAPSGVSLIGNLTCTTVSGGSQITPSLGAGSYTVNGSSCSGLTTSFDPVLFAISYVGAPSGLVVAPQTIAVSVSGHQTYGSIIPVFTQTNNEPSGITLSGTLSCTTVDGGASISPNLSAGPHTLDGTNCSGLKPSDAVDYAVVYSGAASGFVVAPATITVTVSGTQTYGAGAVFTQTNNAPSGINLLGTLVCTTVNLITPISPMLPVGSTYTITGSSCSGLTPSDANDFVISYVGASGGFGVVQFTIVVTVSATQTYGGPPTFTQTNTSPNGITLSGNLSCSNVNALTPISPLLTAGDYTVTGGSCSGLTSSSPTDYGVSYVGAPNGFVVSPASVTVNVSGTEIFGSAPGFTQINDAPSTLTLGGTLACTTVNGGQPIATSKVGSYTVDGSSCSGLTPSDAVDYTLSYVGVTNGFAISLAVSPATLPSVIWGFSYPSTQLSAAGGTGPYTFAVTAGALPTGLTLSSAGLLTGSPTQTPTATFTVTATDQNGNTGTASYTITILSGCESGLTARYLLATTNLGTFTGVFCLNASGVGTYQQGSTSGSGSITVSGSTTYVTASGVGLALIGSTNNQGSRFTEFGPSFTAGSFKLQ